MWQAAFFKKWYKSLSPEMGQDEIVPSDVKKKKDGGMIFVKFMFKISKDEVERHCEK